MSIKTSKRIALGVIAGLVFAPFAAIAPASAAVTVVSIAAGPFTAVSGGSTTFNAVGAGGTVEIAVGLITSTGETLVDGNDFVGDPRITVGTVAGTTSPVTISNLAITGVHTITTAGESTADALDTAAKALAAGVLIARAQIVVVQAQSNALSVTHSNNNNDTINQTAVDTPIVTATRPTGQLLAAGDLRIRVEASADVAMYPIGAVAVANTGAVGAGSKTIVHGADSTIGRSFALANDLTAGTYVFKTFIDANANGLFDSSEANGDVTVVISGVAANSSVSVDRSSIPNAAGAVTAVVTLTDAGGRPAKGNVTLAPSSTTAGAAALITMAGVAANTVSGNLTRIGTTNQFRITATYAVGAAGPGATIVLTSSIGTAKTASFSIQDTLASTATRLALASQTGTAFGAGATFTTVIPARTTDGTTAVTADPAVTSFNFTLTGTAAKVYAVTTTVGANTALGRIAAPASVTTLADGEVTFTVTVTTPTVTLTTADSFTIKVVGVTAGDFSYAVTYANPTAVWTLNPATAPQVLEKSTNKVTAKLTDSYGRVLGSTGYTVAVTGRNVSASTGVTDASGNAEFTLTDSATTSYALVGGFPTDTVTFTNIGTVARPAVAGAVTYTYKTTLAAVGTVTVTVAADNKVIDQVTALAGTPVAGAIATYTATVRTAAGAAVGAGTLVTFAGSANDLFVDGISSGVTNANGQATARVYRQKVGFAAITATANTVVGSARAILWVNGGRPDTAGVFGDHRNVSVSAAQTIAPGSAATVVATVVDRWGNAVVGITVTFSLAGAGRVPTGETLAKRTDINGSAQVQVTSLATETGVNTVTALISGGQTNDLVGFVSAATVTVATGEATGNAAPVAVAKGSHLRTAIAGNRTASSTVTFAAAAVVAPVVPTVVVPPVAPTLTAERQGNRVLLFGTCMVDEGDIIIYVKSPGKAYSEKAKTLECADGEYDGSLRASENTKFYRVKQEGTGLYSTSKLVRP